MSLRVTNPQAPGQVLWRKIGTTLGDLIIAGAIVLGAWVFIAAFALAFGR